MLPATIPIRAISRGIAVLQALNRGRSLSMMEIANASAVPYPTACRIVQTLILENLVEREPSRRRYRPTALVQTLAHGFQGQGPLIQAARPHIVELTHLSSWPVSLTTHVGASMILRDSTHALTSMTLNSYFPGYTLPILESAAGLVYLAYAPADEREGVLHSLEMLTLDEVPHGLRLIRESSATDIVREQGYATRGHNRFTENPGKTSSIAVPVMHGDKVAGAITLAFFSAAFGMDDALARFEKPLKRCAERISGDLLVAA